MLLYDEDSFNEKYDKYYKLIYRTAYQYLYNIEAAEDIVQEVFVKLLTHKKPFNEDEHEKAWLLRVTVNLCKNTLKSKSYQVLQLEDDTNISNCAFVEQSNIKLDLENELKTLKPEQRTALFLFYFEEISIKEISKIMNANENTVKSHLNRAKQKLKNNLREKSNEVL